jgi:hypothetical protein
MPNCGQFTWKADATLLIVPTDAEVWNDVASWVRELLSRQTTRPIDHLWALWTGFNAWGTAAVPDRRRSHEDLYLIYCLAAESRFRNRFDSLMADQAFAEAARELASLAPSFQVVWLLDDSISPCHAASESRAQYISKVRDRDPFVLVKGNRFPAFAPGYAFEHIDSTGGVPVNWPHIVHMIYQVRCNQLHGGKGYGTPEDRRFAALASSILWPMWQPELPPCLPKGVDEGDAFYEPPDVKSRD